MTGKKYIILMLSTGMLSYSSPVFSAAPDAAGKERTCSGTNKQGKKEFQIFNPFAESEEKSKETFEKTAGIKAEECKEKDKDGKSKSGGMDIGSMAQLGGQAMQMAMALKQMQDQQDQKNKSDVSAQKPADPQKLNIASGGASSNGGVGIGTGTPAKPANAGGTDGKNTYTTGTAASKSKPEGGGAAPLNGNSDLKSDGAKTAAKDGGGGGSASGMPSSSSDRANAKELAAIAAGLPGENEFSLGGGGGGKSGFLGMKGGKSDGLDDDKPPPGLDKDSPLAGLGDSDKSEGSRLVASEEDLNSGEASIFRVIHSKIADLKRRGGI